MIAEKIVQSMKGASWIRVMFEEGTRLRKLYGDDKVFDFSIGNPEFEPPVEVQEALKYYMNSGKPGLHRYMSNAGYEDVRDKVAAYHQQESGISLTRNHIIMTCGAAGGLNVVLKTLLNAGEEVIVIAPYFVEYKSYIENQGGIAVVVPADSQTFQPDIGVLEANITPKTKAIIVNTPNNPTGVVYNRNILESMAALLEAKEKEYGTAIAVISDEPYSKIVYDGVQVPSILSIFPHAILVNSFSKSLALPGERIGYIVVSSRIENADFVASGMVVCNRTLGFVNAPGLFQRVIADALDATVNIEEYRKRRDALYNILTEAGFSCPRPQGAFYIFPKSLIEDDVEFVQRAVKYNLLLVPGSGFGWKGHFRVSYCIDLKTIENSRDAFLALAKELK